MAVFRGLFVRKDSTRGTQPAEARKALAGLLVPSSALGARLGILAGPGDPLKVTGTAGWTYQINGGPLVSSRSDADGAVIFGADGTTPTPAVAAAPGSGSRYDLIYLRHQDVDQGGGETSDATLGVLSGVASGTPVKPTLPAGAVLVAEALVAAGATSTAHANVTITNVLGQTVARGGVLPVATQAQEDAVVGYEGLYVTRPDLGLRKWDAATGKFWPVSTRQAFAKVRQSTATNHTAGSWWPVPLQTLEAEGPSGVFTLSGGILSVSRAGMYHVEVHAAFNIVGPHLRLVKNAATTPVQLGGNPSAGNSGTASVGAHVRLVAGDTLNPQVFHSAAFTTNADSDGAATHVTIVRVGD